MGPLPGKFWAYQPSYFPFIILNWRSVRYTFWIKSTSYCKIMLMLNWINPIQVFCFYFSRLTWKPDVLLEWKTLCLRDWSLVWRFYGLEAMLFTIKWEWIETNASNQMIFPPILKIHGTFIKGFEDIHREQKWKKEVCKYNLFDFTYFFYS